MPDVLPHVGAVAIVTYNCASQIRDCLASLAPDRERWQVAVADNGSSDGTPDMIRREFPWVRVVPGTSNIGFAWGCNAAAAATDAPWVLFLNPDTVVPRGALDLLLERTVSRGAVAAAPQLVGSDGKYQAHSADRRLPSFGFLLLETLLVHRLWPGNPWRRRANLAGFDPRTARSVEQPIGAGLFVRRDVFDQLGGFDERFQPIWFEDVDLCRRLIDSGHHIAYVGDVAVTHIGQHSLSYFPTTTVLARWNANLVRYARKHFTRAQAEAIRVGAIVGAVLRGVLRASPGHFRLAGRMMRHANEARWYS
jgi:GT2 family glycosyltransferase